MNYRKFFLPALLLFCAIPLALGAGVGILTRDSMQVYSEIAKPSFSPPAILFPIVWSILYVLMGASLYLVYLKNARSVQYILFAIQLALNLLWPFLFFKFELFTAALVCLSLMWCAILAMIILFARKSKAAALIQIPYLLWSTFALVLNYAVAIMN